jgi:outer membrane protein TolC
MKNSSTLMRSIRIFFNPSTYRTVGMLDGPFLRRVLLHVIVTFLLLVLIARSQSREIPFSLSRCIATGLASAHSIANSGFERDRARYQQREAVGRLLPHVDAFCTYDDYLKTPVQMVPGDVFGQPGTTIPISLYLRHNATAGLRTTQILYDQTALVSLALANTMNKLSAVNLEKAGADLIYDAASLYYLIELTEGQALILEGNAARLDSLSAIISARVREGFVLNTEIERIQTDRGNLLTEICRMRILASRQRDMLDLLIGLEGNGHSSTCRNSILTDSLHFSLLDRSGMLHTGIGSVHDTDNVLRTRSEVRQLELQTELSDLKRSLAIAEFFPTISLYGQWSYQSQRERFDLFTPGPDKWFDVGSIGLTITLPLFDGLQRVARVQQAETEVQQAETNRKFTMRSLRMEYRNAVERCGNFTRNAEGQNAVVKLAKQTLQNTVLQYRQGTASLTDVLVTENELSNSMISHLNALYQLRISELDLLKATGKLFQLVTKD